jgi:hypothetical protein
MSKGVTQSASLSMMRRNRPIWPMDRTAVPPIFRTRSAIESVVAKSDLLSRRAEGDSRESVGPTCANEKFLSLYKAQTRQPGER